MGTAACRSGARALRSSALNGRLRRLASIFPPPLSPYRGNGIRCRVLARAFRQSPCFRAADDAFEQRDSSSSRMAVPDLPPASRDEDQCYEQAVARTPRLSASCIPPLLIVNGTVPPRRLGASNRWEADRALRLVIFASLKYVVDIAGARCAADTRQKICWIRRAMPSWLSASELGF